ncbi:MAG: PQQ-binding-like beta-propeller repeat protein, partial [Flavobacteriales bacterium]|nr:PQQ-binding-like beta-propeller repeat protein [Flavobacteriales bacterium]
EQSALLNNGLYGYGDITPSNYFQKLSECGGLTPPNIEMPDSSGCSDPTFFTESWNNVTLGNVEGDNQFNDIVVDSLGYVYSVGKIHQALGNTDIVIQKLNGESGNMLWQQTINSGIGLSDNGKAISIDGYGNIYITGTSEPNSLSEYTSTIAKYDSEGNQMWISNDIAAGGESISIDPSDEYIYSAGGGGVIKYNALSGTKIWTRSIENALQEESFAKKVIATNDGIFVGGEIFNSLKRNIAVVRYDELGNVTWSSSHGGETSEDYFNSMVIDNLGNTWIVGSSSSWRWMIVKFDYDGLFLWKEYDNSSAQFFSNATDITLQVDEVGSTYVSGETTFGGNFFITTTKYDADGNETWSTDYPISNPSNSLASVTVGVNYLYVTVGASDDVITIKYAMSDGSIQWNESFDGGSLLIDGSNAITLSEEGDVFVTGKTQNVSSNYDMLTIKYSQCEFGILDPIAKSTDIRRNSNIIEERKTHSVVYDSNLKMTVFPNPFTNILNVEISKNKEGDPEEINLQLLDINGRQIYVGNHFTGTTITINSNNIVSGLYVVRVISSTGVLSSKVICTK